MICNESAVVDWLLEENDPSVRYRTLRELLDVSADDQRVKAVRVAIAAPLKAGARGEANKWITLYALLAQKHRTASPVSER